MKTIDFKEASALKSGTLTPKYVLQMAMNEVDDIESVVMCVKRKDGTYEQCCSSMSYERAIFLHENAKFKLMAEQWDSEED